MSQVTRLTCIERLPRKAGVLQGYHAELILELIVQRSGNNDTACDRLYAELEMIELAIAEIEAEVT